MALISFLFCQCKTAFDVDTCHVISNISQLLPSVLWNRKFSDSNIVFQGQCPFPLLPCKTANGHFFFNSLPPSKLPDILRWENFLKFRPMVHCGANFRRRKYRPGWPSLPMTSFPLRGRIRLNPLLNNVRVNRNTKFKRLELLPLESVFQIKSKNPTSPTDNGHCSNPPPPPPPICMAMVRMGSLPFEQFWASIVSFWSWHEDLILTGKSGNYAGIAFIQVAQRWLNRF